MASPTAITRSGNAGKARAAARLVMTSAWQCGGALKGSAVSVSAGASTGSHPKARRA